MIAEVVPLAEISCSICELKACSISQGERGKCRLPFNWRDEQPKKESRTFRTLRVYTRPNAKVYRIAWLRQGHETRLTLLFVEVQWANLIGPLTRWESKEFTARLPALEPRRKGNQSTHRGRPQGRAGPTAASRVARQRGQAGAGRVRFHGKYKFLRRARSNRVSFAAGNPPVCPIFAR